MKPAGELDTTVSTLNAGLFNTVAKGAPFRLILDRGMEKPGSGSMTIAASNAMVQAGLTPQRLWDERAIFGIKSLVLHRDGSVELLGATEALAAAQWPGPSEFIYRGSLGPIDLPLHHRPLTPALPATDASPAATAASSSGNHRPRSHPLTTAAAERRSR